MKKIVALFFLQIFLFIGQSFSDEIPVEDLKKQKVVNKPNKMISPQDMKITPEQQKQLAEQIELLKKNQEAHRKALEELENED